MTPRALRNLAAFVGGLVVGGWSTFAAAVNCAMVAPGGQAMNVTIPDSQAIAAGYVPPGIGCNGFGACCPDMLAESIVKYSNFNAASIMNPFALDLTEGTLVGFAIMGVWAATWGVKQLVRVVREG